MNRAPKRSYICGESPVTPEPRPSDLTWLFWEFGDRAFSMMAESKDIAKAFSEKYRLFESPDHPLLSAIYRRFREMWAEMHIALGESQAKKPKSDARQRALGARRKARILMSCLWPYLNDEVNALRRARGLQPARLGRGRFSLGLQSAIDGWELEWRESGRWTQRQLAERFCIYQNHKHESHCIERFKTNRSALRRKLKDCDISLEKVRPASSRKV